MKRIVALVLIFTMYFMPVVSLASNLQNQKNEIEEEIKATQNKVNNVKNQKTGVAKQIDAIGAELKEASNELNKIDAELDTVNRNVERIEKELKEVEAKREKHYMSLKIRMRDMYENSTTNYLDMFFEADNLIDLLANVYNVKLIMDKDEEVLNEIIALEEEIKVKKAEIEENKLRLVELKTKAENKKYAMETKMKEQERLLSQLYKEEQSYFNKLTNLEDEQAEIEALINGTASGSQVYDGGKFLWPVPGRSYISSSYVNRINPISGKKEFHSGIDIPAPTGSKIVATAAGTVSVAGWVNGYGYTVIIDHGSGYSSLYGHNSGLTVKAGQKVYKGQQIAKAGSTGYSSGPHSHFEIRKNGKHTNPLPLLGKIG